MATGINNLPNPGMSFTPFDILTAAELNQMVANIEALATGAGIGDGAIPAIKLASSSVTSDKVDVATLPLYAFLTIPYDGTKTGAVTTINTGITFAGKTLRIHYRCFNAAVTSPGTFTQITTVAFASVFPGATSGISDIKVVGRYAASNDIFALGGDVASSQRLTGKFSATTKNFEVWGNYGGATAAYGTVMIYEWV